MPSSSVATVNLDVHVSRAFYVVAGAVWLLVAATTGLSKLLPKLIRVDVLKSYHIEGDS